MSSVPEKHKALLSVLVGFLLAPLLLLASNLWLCTILIFIAGFAIAPVACCAAVVTPRVTPARASAAGASPRISTTDSLVPSSRAAARIVIRKP